MKRPNISLILMPTMECNMACSYCYVLEKVTGTMDIRLAKRAIEQIMDYNDASVPTNVYWHGAEPLLAGINFYREICQWTRERYGIDAIHHHLQTNGLLLNDDWYDFFIQEHITAGVSLDGPPEIHDMYRKNRAGKGTFHTIFDNIMSAREKKLFFDVLCVITRKTLGHEQEMFDFFYENKINFGFEPIVPEDEYMERELSIPPLEYAGFVIKMFDLWFYQTERRLPMVTPPYHFLMGILQGSNTTCHFSGTCASRYLAVSPNGDVHSCVLFARHPQLSFGNIARQDLKEILCSPVRQVFQIDRAAKIPQCCNCQWVSICRGGCPHHAFIASGSLLQLDLFCESYQQIFKHVYGRVAEMLQSQQSEHPIFQ